MSSEFPKANSESSRGPNMFQRLLPSFRASDFGSAFGFRPLAFLRAFSLFLLLLAASASAAPLLTRWAATVSPTNALPEYPRPQLVRQQWQNLNGLWDYAITPDNRHAPGVFTNHILVPFPLESYLSGVGRHLDESSTLWYRRRFTLPASWRSQRVQLHFGAVDWAAQVFLNGCPLGLHRGGYDPFSFDLTPVLKWGETNELLVAVTDPTEGDQPRGKQSRKPEGIFYTASSGIWQTVWLEPLPAVHLDSLRLVPDFAAGALRVQALVNAPAENLQVEVAAAFSGQEAGRAAGLPAAELTVPLQVVRPWSPGEPALYDLVVTLRRGNDVLDQVRSYFGLRDIRVGADESGARRLLLNGQPLFELGVLDQGFWPDGLYTAPADDALRFDLQTVKRLGFNLVRKHVKVEPERWYYWADRLGLLVWQDMPSGNNSTEGARRQFEMELQHLVEQRANHPCIVSWVLFNEGWGQFDTERLVRRLKVADPTRLVDNASGWTDLKTGDVIDLHNYPNPLVPPVELTRAGVLGEFGGLGLPIANHIWSARTWGYQGMSDAAKLTQQYALLLDKVWELQKTRGLAAAVYTQLTDVETECNGFLTYDREVLKMEAAKIRQVNLQHPDSQPVPMLLPNAQQGEFSWAYTTNCPAADWVQPAFDASAWPQGIGGFGTTQAPNVIVHTPWTTGDIWLRREFTLEKDSPAPLALLMHHDEDAEVYLNGVLAVTAREFTVQYQEYALSNAARLALHPGRNVIAIHCHQTTGGQFIDAGLLAEPAVR